LRAQDSAALASSIYMVCRKRPADAPVGELPAVRREIEARVRERLAQFWEAGIRGADFFMSAIGPAVEAFGRYAYLPGPAERGPELERAERFDTMVDALHYALWLWSRNDLKRLSAHLEATYGGNEAFWQVAQAISEVLPEKDQEKEKMWLQGLLAGRRTYAPGHRQSRLWGEGGEP
ncbi:MAG: hypothetical protein NZM16_03350, partial [Thermoflexus sp.]